MIAAHPSPERAPTEALKRFLGVLAEYATRFDSEEYRATRNIAFIKEKFGYPETDIQAWLQTVRYPNSCNTLSGEVIRNTLSVLEKAGVVQPPAGGFQLDQFMNTNVATLD